MVPEITPPNFDTLPKTSAKKRKGTNGIFMAVCVFTALASVIILVTLLSSVWSQGYSVLGWRFLTSPPSSDAATAGIGPSLTGTIWVVAGCALIALPLGVGTAVFLEEYKPTSRWVERFHNFVQLNISNLAGVPSIVYGILGLTAFAGMFGLFGNEKEPHFEMGATYFRQYVTEGQEVVFIPIDSRTETPSLRDGMIVEDARGNPVKLNIIGPNDDYPEDEALAKTSIFEEDEGGLYVNESWYFFRLPFGRSVIAASLTLMLVILPIIIIASQESLRGVPSSLREAALGLGATRWQVVRNVTLPAAVPGIMTGSILSTSRAIGEAAPLLIIAGLVYSKTLPDNLMSNFLVLPLQIFYWAGQPIDQNAEINFQTIAAGGIIVLLVILLSFNAIAIAIRQFSQKPND